MLLRQAYLLTQFSCSQTFASLTIFDRPDLFLHPDFEIGKQNKEQRMVLFAKGPAIGEHKGQWEIPSLKLDKDRPKKRQSI